MTRTLVGTPDPEPPAPQVVANWAGTLTTGTYPSGCTVVYITAPTGGQ